MNNFLDCGEAVLQAFRCLDMDYVMSSPGSEWGPVWEAFARQNLAGVDGPVLLNCAHETLATGLAIGYTAMTGRMQAVMLHTGVGLLQGAMGIDGAHRQNLPMVVVSGESLSFGEARDFDPGAQWQSSLSTAGGPHRLAEPFVKWSVQASSSASMFGQIISAGELAQRTPAGPVFVSVPIENMVQPWNPPSKFRQVPVAPKLRPSDGDVEKVAALLASAESPLIIAESAGRSRDGYEALVTLAEMLQIPVIETAWADHTNFPKDHHLHQGIGRPAIVDEADLVLTVGCRSAWYPPANRPKNAAVVVIDEVPFRMSYAYHNSPGDYFLEGDPALSLELLAEALDGGSINRSAAEDRRKVFKATKSEAMAADAALVGQVQEDQPVPAAALSAILSAAMPEDTIYVDETVTHRGLSKRYLSNQGPLSYYHAAGGLGQGLGVSLGVKIAEKNRPVVTLIGDGTFMYNPSLQAMALARQEGLATLTVIYNNNGYEAMRLDQRRYYPGGVAEQNDMYLGQPLAGFDYAELASHFGGFGRRVETAGDLDGALGEARRAIAGGQSAILNVMVEA